MKLAQETGRELRIVIQEANGNPAIPEKNPFFRR
jgi:hypothetical protein